MLTVGGVIVQVFARANQAMQVAAAVGALSGVALLVAAVVIGRPVEVVNAS
jgi:hypothetical protein